jgi:hypothetical protein
VTTLNKDQSIVLQVAAKIAADLTIHNPNRGDLDGMIVDFVHACDAVYEHLSNAHGWSGDAAQPMTETQAVNMVMAAFEAQPVESTQMTVSSSVRVKGKQHGPLPEWFIREAQAAGVSEVWDNRDQLAVNPKRPHFKDANGDKAFWPPRGRA